MPYTQIDAAFPHFIVDPSSVMNTNGYQVDWANVPASFQDAAGVKRIPAGYPMAKTADGLVPRGAADGTLPAAEGLLYSDASEDVRTDALTGYGFIRGAVVYAELLPVAGDAAFATIQTELGPRFAFETYADSRAA